MGKRIRVQRRGRGGSTYRASSHKRIAQVKYPPAGQEPGEGVLQGRIKELFHEPGRGAPLARIELGNEQEYYFVVPEGVYEGQEVQLGEGASVDVGNVLPLDSIPEGVMVFGIELSPGDGGKIARSSGAYATVIGHTPQGTMIKYPSGKTKRFNNLCRATIGVVSGAGRLEKPFLKAGSLHHKKKAKGHKYPRNRGIAMVAAVHPYGSSKKGGRKVTTVSRGAPPGKKVGLIAASGSGKRRRRR